MTLLVIQWLSNVHLHCWFADSGRQTFFFIEGEKKSCSLCPWNFWIVASGNADTFNEEINMFVFYSAYLWMKRRAVMLWRVVLFPLLVFASSWGRCLCAATQLGWALSCAVAWCVTFPHMCCWQCSSCSTPRLSVPAPLCTVRAGRTCRTKSMGSWGSNPTHWYEQPLLWLQQWGWDGEHHAKKTEKTTVEGVGCDLLQLGVFLV